MEEPRMQSSLSMGRTRTRSPSRPFTPLSEPDLGAVNSEPDNDGSEDGTGSGASSPAMLFMPRRSNRRCVTEPPSSMLEFLRDQEDAFDDDDDDQADLASGLNGSTPDMMESIPSRPTALPTPKSSKRPPPMIESLLQPIQPIKSDRGSDGEDLGQPLLSRMMSRQPSLRTPSHRSRRNATSPYRRRVKKLHFRLDTSPLKRRPVPVEVKRLPSWKHRAWEGASKALTLGVALAFGVTMAWLLLASILWALRGRQARFRDMFEVDLDHDGQWSMYEYTFSLGLNSGVLALGLVLAKAVLTICFYAWIGLKAIRKNRRTAEMQKTSPFLFGKGAQAVDHSMLEYFQTNYDFGPVTTLVPTSPKDSGGGDAEGFNGNTDSGETTAGSQNVSGSDGASGQPDGMARNDSRGRSTSGTSGAPTRSRRPSFTSSMAPTLSGERRSMRRNDTAKSASEYVSLDAQSQDEMKPNGSDASKGLGGSDDGGCPMTIQPSWFENTKLQESICKLSDWNFDIFEVAEATPRPLAFIGFVCLDAYSKLVDFEKRKLLEFLRAVESSYRKVPYHNSLHGASVARGVYSFCAGCGLSFTQEYMEFTIVLAGLVHDVHHPGLTATFLSKASVCGEWNSPVTSPLEYADMELSLKYNDQSPLENMHCAITFELLRNSETAFLAKEEVAAMRKPLLRAILGTDMAKHAETMTRLAALIDNLQHECESGSVPWHWPAQPPATASEEQRAVWERLYQEEFVLELFLHAADIGNPTLPFDQWVRWNRLCQNEFHDQGDREMLEFGELISPAVGFDRKASVKAEHGFTKGFMQYLALPLFQQLHDLTQVRSPNSVCQGVNIMVCVNNLKKNIGLWEDYTPVRDEDEPNKGRSASKPRPSLL